MSAQMLLANSVGNESFQLRNVSKIVEMAVSSSKMLQIARTPGRKKGKKKQKKKEKQNNSRPPSIGRISSLVGSLKTPLWKQTGTNTPQE